MRRGALVVVCVCLTWNGAQSKVVIDPYKAQYDEFESSFRNGLGWSDNVNSANLAWAESMFLQSYIVMYRAYRDTTYLDKLVTHFDRMRTRLSDADRDGFLGWQTIDYAVERLVNGGFEVAGDDGLPVKWQLFAGSDGSVAISTTPGEFVSGRAALVIRSKPSLGTQGVQQSIGFTPHALYRLSFRAKTTATQAHVEVFDVTSNATVAARSLPASEWTPYALQFVMPDAGHHVEVRLTASQLGAPAAVTVFDDLSLRHQAEYFVEDGMILQPIADFVLEVTRTPALSRYATKAAEYRDLIVNNFFRKWESTWRGDSDVYVFPNDDQVAVNGEPSPAFGRESSLPHNQYLPFARVFRAIGRATTNDDFLNRAHALASTFKRALEVDPDYPNALRWRYADLLRPQDEGRSPTDWEDSAHANIDVQAMVDFGSTGTVFTAEDLTRLTNTFLDVVWLPTRQQLAGAVNGARLVSAVRPDPVWGWAELARFDARVWQVVQSLNARYPADGQAHYRVQIMAVLADWNPQRVVNRSFEDIDIGDPTMPARWRRWQATSATVYRSTDEDVRTGDAALVIRTRPSAGPQIAEQPIAYTAGARATVTFSARAGRTAVGRVEIYDATDRVVLNAQTFSAREWTNYSFDFEAPAREGHELVIRITHDQWAVAGAVLFVDDVEIRRVR